MSLIMITEAMRFIEEADAVISMEDKEFVAKYAFRTGDTDLVKKLIEELQEKDADREKVQTKYMQLADNKPEWAEQVENLVIALTGILCISRRIHLCYSPGAFLLGCPRILVFNSYSFSCRFNCFIKNLCASCIRYLHTQIFI